MKKKLFKYIKFFVSIALILSLVAPSYASLTASDGSAFVTKAEFDSALADFNSRLTTFEAGINSKIDSQVTSYLDRNGIWSRKVQTMTQSYVDIRLGASYSFGGSNNDMGRIIKKNDIIISKISKSGLARCTIWSNVRSWWASQGKTITTSGSYGTLSMPLTVWFTSERFDATGSVGVWQAAGNCVPSRSITNLSWEYSPMIMEQYDNTWRMCWARSAFQEEVYFFVQKDKTLYASLTMIGAVWGQWHAGANSVSMTENCPNISCVVY